MGRRDRRLLAKRPVWAMIVVVTDVLFQHRTQMMFTRDQQPTGALTTLKDAIAWCGQNLLALQAARPLSAVEPMLRGPVEADQPNRRGLPPEHDP
jgi:hypothetical protein